MTTTNLTPNELEALQSIFENQYHDECPAEQRIGNPVYTESCNPFRSLKTFSGVMSSLSKKGLVGSDDECCWITRKGFEELKSRNLINL